MIAEARGVHVRCRVTFRQSKPNRPLPDTMIHHLRKCLDHRARVHDLQVTWTGEQSAQR